MECTQELVFHLYQEVVVWVCEGLNQKEVRIPAHSHKVTKVPFTVYGPTSQR